MGSSSFFGNAWQVLHQLHRPTSGNSVSYNTGHVGRRSEGTRVDLAEVVEQFSTHKGDQIETKASNVVVNFVPHVATENNQNAIDGSGPPSGAHMGAINGDNQEVESMKEGVGDVPLKHLERVLEGVGDMQLKHLERVYESLAKNERERALIASIVKEVMGQLVDTPHIAIHAYDVAGKWAIEDLAVGRGSRVFYMAAMR